MQSVLTLNVSYRLKPTPKTCSATGRYYDSVGRKKEWQKDANEFQIPVDFCPDNGRITTVTLSFLLVLQLGFSSASVPLPCFPPHTSLHCKWHPTNIISHFAQKFDSSCINIFMIFQMQLKKNLFFNQSLKIIFFLCLKVIFFLSGNSSWYFQCS